MERDLTLVDRLARLHPAVVSDCLDREGLREQVLAPHIRPLATEMRVAGYAATVHCIEVDAVPASKDDWYRNELAAVDALQAGDVLVVSTCRGSFWGELLATASLHRGARGAVMDAFTRDTLALIDLGFPTFAAGVHCADSLGRIDVDAYDVPITCGGVEVTPGDLVLGDHDGVVVIPSAAGEEIVALAEEKMRGENLVREKLAEGMPVSEAFRTYGVI
jgi:4-hydroxy-4-methyl-2-oxoglutarate aldolase